MPRRPVKNAVIAPIVMHDAQRDLRLCSNSGDIRATMKMPAVTIVAAWIRAEIGRRAFHRIGQPDVQRHLRRLAHRADEQADAENVSSCHGVPRDDLDRLAGEPLGVAERQRVVESAGAVASAAMPSRKPKSPTRLTRNAFMFAKIAVGRVYQKPIRRYETTPDRFPAEEQLQEVVAHHEHQHREREQRDVAEEPLVARVVVHVADRVDVHGERHERHDHHHQRGEMIDQEPDLERHAADRDAH